MKPNLVLALLFLLSSILVVAQEKYEFCIIEYFPKKEILSISKNGTEHSSEIVNFRDNPKNGYHSVYDANPLLERVKLFQEKDWEVMSFNTNLVGRRYSKRIYSAYLRKKIK